MSTLAIVGIILLVVIIGLDALWIMARLSRPSRREQIETQRRAEIARARWAQHQAEARMNAITQNALRRMADVASQNRAGRQ